MKTTVDIPNELLKDAMKWVGTKVKNVAVVSAMRDYVRRRKLEDFLSRVGTSTTFMTHEELMAMRELDMPPAARQRGTTRRAKRAG